MYTQPHPPKTYLASTQRPNNIHAPPTRHRGSPRPLDRRCPHRARTSPHRAKICPQPTSQQPAKLGPGRARSSPHRSKAPPLQGAPCTLRRRAPFFRNGPLSLVRCSMTLGCRLFLEHNRCATSMQLPCITRVAVMHPCSIRVNIYAVLMHRPCPTNASALQRPRNICGSRMQHESASRCSIEATML